MADSRHFYNIWTQYACIRPDELDPSLGTPDDFKQLVASAHALGIKVILDVITHGVMADSPLIQEKPHWFRGGTWGMVDYDWFGGHADMDDWWVDLWVHYVEAFDVDGFRLDVATYRPDLWARIRRRAEAIEHPIVIIAENGAGYQGVTDFLQGGTLRLSSNRGGLETSHPLLSDLAACIQDTVQPFTSQYAVRIEYRDGSTAGGEDSTFPAAVEDQGIRRRTELDTDGGSEFVHHEAVLLVSGAPADRAIANVVVTDQNGQEWQSRPWVHRDYAVTVEAADRGLRLVLPVQYPPEQ